jgi:hypothetical protein
MVFDAKESKVVER